MLVYAVEDELSIQELYKLALTKAGMDIICFDSGMKLLSQLQKKLPDIILLDIMMDGMDGYEVLRVIKNDDRYTDVPVILVSAKGEEQSKVKGLDMGADDYIAKPFGIAELIARIKVNTRKSASVSEVFEYKGIAVDKQKHTIKINGEKIDCPQKIFALIKYLVVGAGKVVTKEELISKIWQDEDLGNSRTLDVHINEVRKRLVKCGSEVSIQTVRGVGYILQ